MLYVAPKGSNDDWYWLYSTVYEGRRTPAYVVSNDYMRDHRATFAESRAFLRWRSSQIVYFSFSKAVEPLQLSNASYALPTVSLYRPGTP
jgi:proteinaceous RNase P